MDGIIPEKHRRKIFESLSTAALDLIIKEGEVVRPCYALFKKKSKNW